MLISKKKKDQFDLLFENLNNHHPNIKHIIETMPQKFLDTKIIYKDNQIKTKVNRNQKNLSVHWTSKIPKCYERNVINADLNRATRIGSTFTAEIQTSTLKVLNFATFFYFRENLYLRKVAQQQNRKIKNLQIIIIIIIIIKNKIPSEFQILFHLVLDQNMLLIPVYLISLLTLTKFEFL